MGMPTANAVADQIVTALQSLPAYDPAHPSVYTKAAMVAIVTPILDAVRAGDVVGTAGGVQVGASSAPVTGALT